MSFLMTMTMIVLIHFQSCEHFSSILEVFRCTLALAFDQRAANELDSSLNWFSKCGAGGHQLIHSMFICWSTKECNARPIGNSNADCTVVVSYCTTSTTAGFNCHQCESNPVTVRFGQHTFWWERSCLVGGFFGENWGFIDTHWWDWERQGW